MMHSVGYIFTIFWFLIFAVIGSESRNSQNSARSSLDSLLQETAFKGLSWPKTKTGTVYEGSVPSDLLGIKISALMLKGDSLKWRGYGYYNEFLIPTGVVEEPYVTRIVLVYQNIGNLSSFYYPLPGYIYLTPVVGILAYDAMDMCAKNKSQLNIHALENPININFTDVQSAPDDSLVKCVYFNSNSSVEFSNVTNGNVCSTSKQGHFAIVAELKIAPSPAPSDHGNQLNSKVLTISVGFLIFAVLGILVVVGKKCVVVVVERRIIMEDSAAIIEPLLGAAIVRADEPLPDEGPSRRLLVEDEYAIRPLPENDYVPENDSEPENDPENDSEPENDYAV